MREFIDPHAFCRFHRIEWILRKTDKTKIGMLVPNYCVIYSFKVQIIQEKLLSISGLCDLAFPAL